MLQQPAEAMARAAGSAFRLFAGTDSLNVGFTASHSATLDPNDPQVHTELAARHTLVVCSNTASGRAARVSHRSACRQCRVVS